MVYLLKLISKLKVLSKFTILCWVAFIAILGFRWPAGHRSDIPGREWYKDLVLYVALVLFRDSLQKELIDKK